ncbi:iron dependent repressor [Natrinema pellirubrum DSM 15624]|uniref:Iron dependent repressor n=1 Tax=Natrinema pellirubrum (strain DSM 15624 / CIP 106293 / JCM 10476 / NCIMB 786 / 157) TaxID=797303 RepID=L0JN44_NATP1|nr:metal-dependent transcriptional regulator [Natrinema pellirubrum]AGB32945.1 Mn-dependent transcriptional regulator [Natrinema pellirubrum DSM 15624]ELY75329.1 iron dependent repressor [Natrinema pellirubrum DSM 15624]
MTDASQYLLVCYLGAQETGEPVSPGYVADELERSPSVTTETLQRLEQRGYLRYEPYEGATLTEQGREAAADLHERYVVLSTFFREVLDLAEPDREAMTLAGSVSPLVTERVAETLLEAEDIEAIDVPV